MFGFGKKKDKKNENEALQVIKAAGLATNEVKNPSKMTRGENAEAQRKIRASAMSKDQLLDELNKLRKELNYNPDYGDYSIQIEEMIVKFKRMKDSANKNAMAVVDSLILEAIDKAMGCCNRNNYIGIGSYLYSLDGYLNDRSDCTNIYLSEKFCKLTVEKNRLNYELRKYQADYDNCVKRLEQLQKDYNKNIGLSKQSVVDEIANLKSQGAQAKEFVNQIEARIRLTDNCIKQVKTQDINHGFDSIFDIDNMIDEILGIKKQNEIDASTTDKYNEKLEQNNRKVSSSALDVNSETFEKEKPIEITDDMFKMD